jgi:acetolactate synthase I/II/III large subunit
VSGKLELNTFSEELAFEFAEAGIRDVFLVTGGAIAPFTAALASQGRIRMHYMLTEQSAGIAAESYGYFDGNPAMLVVTSGPGVTNALTPVAAAYANSAPVIVVSGQARSADVALSNRTKSRQIGNQHLRTDQLASSVVKQFLEVKEVSSSKEIVASLLFNAKEGRPGPVWLSIPQDLQRAPLSQKLLGIKSSESQPGFDGIYFKKLLEELLSKSISPSILIGAGARKAQKPILEFAKRFRIPVMTTWPGMDLIPESSPLYCGRPGSIPSSWAPNFINVETDLLIVLGARLDLGQVGYNPNGFAPEANVIRVDVDKEEFARIPERENWFNFEVEITQIIKPLSEINDLSQASQLDAWWTKIDSWRDAYPSPIEIKQTFDDGISSYELLLNTSKLFAESTIITGSSGTCMEMLLQSWRVHQGQRVINSCGIGSMGFALAAAIGVAVKKNPQELLCIESDGSFAMNLQDLVTMRSMDTNFKIIIMDSSGYKSISLSQDRLGQESHGNSVATSLNLPDIKIVSNALGIESRQVSHSNELLESLAWLADQAVSSLLVVKVSQKEEALPRLVSKPNSQGMMVTPPMNMLSPKM